MTKEMTKKVKRPRVNWYEKIRTIKDEDKRLAVWHTYYCLTARNPKMSQNRRAYLALSSHYSHRSLDCARWLGCGVDLL